MHILPALDAPLHAVGLLDDRPETRATFEQAGLSCLDPHDPEALAKLDALIAGK